MRRNVSTKGARPRSFRCMHLVHFFLSVSFTVYIEPRFGLLSNCDGIGERFTYYIFYNNVAWLILKFGFSK